MQIIKEEERRQDEKLNEDYRH